MLLGKKVHPLSFDFGKRAAVKGGGVELAGDSFKARVRCDAITEFCTRLRVENLGIKDTRHYSDAILEEFRAGKPVKPARKTGAARFEAPGAAVEVGTGRLAIRFPYGLALETTAEGGLGFCGTKTMFSFEVPLATGFHGFGERTKRFNKSGESMEFLTVDVMAVMPFAYQRDDYDPTYVSIPLAILRVGDQCCGLYFDSGEHLVMDCGTVKPGHFIVQLMHGATHLYLINGPALRDVVRNFTTLTGRAEVPPVWALGYHQCRWGYQTAQQFDALAEDFARNDLPLSSLWYDIDYMDGYRVFTWDKTDIPRPDKLNESLKRRGIRTVAIVDPGVKLDPAYDVYKEGKARDLFCKAPSGRDYVGQVWPGDTLFPDFTEPATREWWAERMARFLDEWKLDGAWLDMNDPATGWVSAEDMLFEKGKTPHQRFHNQYGHLMAKASRMGFEKLDPARRPFLLTRSGFAGTQRYSAIWTGDNDSNWGHLRMSIPCTINLGLSGVAFNGPDVGGFAGNATPELLVRWYQAGFLFPFFRNHSIANSKTQEPWQFGREVTDRIRDVIYTRYRLLPYLYQCFFQSHLTGDPILRPLLYHYDDRELENVDDQYLVGDCVMVAPIVESESTGDMIVAGGVRRQLRHITFPAGWWYDVNIGEWTQGGRTIRYAAALDETPVFVREGAILPWYDGKIRNAETPAGDFELHVFLRERGSAAATTLYLDDQKTRNYLKGDYNTAHVTVATAEGEATLRIEETGPRKAGGADLARLVFYGAPFLKSVNGPKTRKLKPARRRWLSKEVEVLAT